MFLWAHTHCHVFSCPTYSLLTAVWPWVTAIWLLCKQAYHTDPSTGTSSWSCSEIPIVGYLGQRGKAASLPLMRHSDTNDFTTITHRLLRESHGVMIKGRSLSSECLPTSYLISYNNVCARSSCFLQKQDGTEIIHEKPNISLRWVGIEQFGHLNINILMFPGVNMKSVFSASSDAAGGGRQNAQASWDQCWAWILWGLQQKAVWYLQILPKGKSRPLFFIAALLSDQGSKFWPYAVFCYELASY